MQVRDYRPEDFSSLCGLDRLCFPESIAYTPEEIALALAQRGAFACVAEVEQRVVAFVLAYQKKPLIGHIVTLDVHRISGGRASATISWSGPNNACVTGEPLGSSWKLA